MITDEMTKIVEAIKASVPVEMIYLFGSYAYGTPREDSDYDFYVVIPDGSMRPLLAIMNARIAASKIRGQKTDFDILANTTSNFDARKRLNTLESVVFNKGVLLYAKSQHS